MYSKRTTRFISSDTDEDIYYASKSIPNLKDNTVPVTNTLYRNEKVTFYQPSYRIIYLGSAILTNGKTGLGSLQDPLRELYSIYRERGFANQERHLIISFDGIKMCFNEFGIEKYIENDLESVYDVQLLQLFCEKRRDKKVYGAFLPIDGNQYDPKYENLYSPIKKQHSHIIDPPHPYLIALTMRRSIGLQALECHVFTVNSFDEARSIRNQIRSTCDRYKMDLNEQSNLFQYRPSRIDKSTDKNYEIYTNGNNNRSSSYYELNDRRKLSAVEKEKKGICKKSTKDPIKTESNTSLHHASLFDKLKSNFKSKPKDSARRIDVNHGYPNDKNERRSSSTHAKFHKQNDVELIRSIKKPDDDQASVKSDKSQKSLKKLNTGLTFLKLRTKSPSPSEHSMIKIKNESKNKKSDSIVSLADIDFHNNQKTYNENIQIDEMLPVNTLSRPHTPLNSRQIATDSQEFYADPNYNRNMNRSRSALATAFVNTENPFESTQPRSTSVISERILSNRYEKEIKTIETNPELLSNHLIWNSEKKIAEVLDPISIKPITKFRDDDASIYANYDKVFSNNERKRTIYQEAPSKTELPFSYIGHDYFTKDSAYNTNSSNEDVEQDYYTAKTTTFMPERLYKTTQPNYECKVYSNYEAYDKTMKTNPKHITGGVKVYPTMPKNRQYVKNDEMSIPINYQRRNENDTIDQNSSHIRYKSQVTIPTTSYLNESQQGDRYNYYKKYPARDNDLSDNEVIDLTRNSRQMKHSGHGSRAHTPYRSELTANHYVKANDYEYREAYNRNESKSYRNTKQAQPLESSNFNYYFGDEKFVGY